MSPPELCKARDSLMPNLTRPKYFEEGKVGTENRNATPFGHLMFNIAHFSTKVRYRSPSLGVTYT